MKKNQNLLDKSKLLAIQGKIIFAQRMKQGLTQSDLAKKAGVSLKTIAQAEGRTDNLTIGTMDKIFRALDLSTKEVAIHDEYLRWERFPTSHHLR